jgi:CheY-like chemotaxis protein
MKTVLIIDDNEADLFLDEIVIKGKFPDVKILKATDGEEALTIIEQNDKIPDVILLDINMPRMDGHQFLEAFTEENTKEIPVIIMLTSSNQDRDKEKANRYKCVKDYFLKPLTDESIEGLTDFLSTKP